MGNAETREAATQDVAAVSDRPIGGAGERCEQADPVLTDLAITLGAEPIDATHYWTTRQDGGATARVQATTRPARAAGVVFDGDAANPAGLRATLSRAVVGDFEAGAVLNSPRAVVRLDVCDLTNLVSDLPIAVGGTTRKGYLGYIPGGDSTLLTATTAPDDATRHGRLRWTHGAATGVTNQRRLGLVTPGDHTISVTLGTPAIGQIRKDVVLQVRNWPQLSISRIDFSGGHVLNNDTLADFDRVWRHSRRTETASTKFNPPQCYTRNTPITLQARFRVTEQPFAPENVTARGTANFGGTQLRWTSPQFVVAPGHDFVNFVAVASDNPLPNVVGHYPNTQITWEMTDPNNNWIPAGQSTHDFYALLNDPANANPNYWTLVHYSCANGHGTNADIAFADAAFGSYTGRDIRRKRDNRPMTYWDPRTVARGNGTTAALLGSNSRRASNPAAEDGGPGWTTEKVAVGHCGSWAESFRDMLAIHGLTAHKVNVKPRFPLLQAAPATGSFAQGGFLVNTWTFAPATPTLRNRLTHTYGTTCALGAQAPGQNNPTPPPRFLNHFVVYFPTSGRLYDPSYGTSFLGATMGHTLRLWEMGSISGLFNNVQPSPNAGYATTAVPPPIRRLNFIDMVALAYL